MNIWKIIDYNVLYTRINNAIAVDSGQVGLYLKLDRLPSNKLERGNGYDGNLSIQTVLTRLILSRPTCVKHKNFSEHIEYSVSVELAFVFLEQAII